MLRLDQVRYGTDAFSLSADFALTASGITAVIGPSGAGKSTLLDLIAGFRRADSGTVWIKDQNVTQTRPGARPVAMVFQDNNLFPHLSIRQNLVLALQPKTGRATAADRDTIATALDQVGLGDMGDRRPGTLSGGQQSRAALARVLVQNRPLVLLDEPFAALGPALKADMLDLVEELTQRMGALTLLVTHDPMDAQSHAAQTLLVDGGRVHAPQSTQALFANPPEALSAYLGRARR